MSATTEWVSVRGLTKQFGDTRVLDHLDLDIRKGEIIVVIGPSGTGKSTLLRCLNLLEKPDSGKLQLNELLIDDLAHTSRANTLELRRKTAFVFQNYALFANKTALDNVVERLLVVDRMPRQQARQHAQTLLERVGLGDRGGSYPSALSGGQQQRVGIARAMAANADLMLFDEPTSALDPEWVGEVLEVMKKLASQHQTMLIVSHEMRFARDIADRIIFMEGGRIVEQGPPVQIFEQPQDPRTQAFLGKVLSEGS